MESLSATLGKADLSALAGLLCVCLGVGASILGGILGGIWVGGKDLGTGLAGMMGGFYGPVAAVPALLIAVFILFLL